MTFRKNKNLKNYLVRAKLRTNPRNNRTQNIPDINLQIEHQPLSDNPTIDPFHIPDDSVSFCPITSCFLHKYHNKSLKYIAPSPTDLSESQGHSIVIQNTSYI